MQYLLCSRLYTFLLRKVSFFFEGLPRNCSFLACLVGYGSGICFMILPLDVLGALESTSCRAWDLAFLSAASPRFMDFLSRGNRFLINLAAAFNPVPFILLQFTSLEGLSSGVIHPLQGTLYTALGDASFLYCTIAFRLRNGYILNSGIRFGLPDNS